MLAPINDMIKKNDFAGATASGTQLTDVLRIWDVGREAKEAEDGNREEVDEEGRKAVDEAGRKAVDEAGDEAGSEEEGDSEGRRTSAAHREVS
jgi:hypothetical protein